MDKIDKKYRELCSKLGSIELKRIELGYERGPLLKEVPNAAAAKAAFPKESAELHLDVCIGLGDILFQLKSLDIEEDQLVQELNELDKEVALMEDEVAQNED